MTTTRLRYHLLSSCNETRSSLIRGALFYRLWKITVFHASSMKRIALSYWIQRLKVQLENGCFNPIAQPNVVTVHKYLEHYELSLVQATFLLVFVFLFQSRQNIQYRRQTLSPEVKIVKHNHDTQLLQPFHRYDSSNCCCFYQRFIKPDNRYTKWMSWYCDHQFLSIVTNEKLGAVTVVDNILTINLIVWTHILCDQLCQHLTIILFYVNDGKSDMARAEWWLTKIINFNFTVQVFL